MLVKFPKIHFLPWSETVSRGDRVLEDLSILEASDIVVTEKMDGENTTMMRNHIHSRSLDSGNHPSRNWVKALWGRIAWEIPTNWRLVGENVFAKHSIFYDRLPSYFLLFAVYDERNVSKSWSEVVEIAKSLELSLVPVLHRGPWNHNHVKACWKNASRCGKQQEGYVVRIEREFNAEEHERCMAKFVRRDHVQTDEHWMNGPIIQNVLA